MREITLALPALPDSIPVARHVLDRLEDSVEQSMLEDLRLLVSEVVTNSIRHGPGGQIVELRVSVNRRVVRVEVEDAGSGFEPPVNQDAERTAGWGLMLVDRLADRWGVSSARTTTVWFEIDRST
ncbi:MAG: ATP-binding protein [Actinobacteria bacterium]|nr:ATP-binding protein [Actinomycetota bacterium]